MSKNYELLYLGDQCAPQIIINWLLNYRNPLPFQLMYSDIDAITQIIMDDFKYIIDPQYLTNKSNNQLKIIRNVINRHDHNNTVYHSKYNISFNHDFDVYENKILNYGFIRKSWDKKIDNFTNIMTSQKYKIFIAFTEKEINIEQYIKFKKLIENKYNTNDIHIIIFNKYETYDYLEHNIYTIKLNVFDLSLWWYDLPEKKYESFVEIYNKFYKIMDKIGRFVISEFEESIYYKTMLKR